MRKIAETVDTVTTGLLRDVRDGDPEAWTFLVELYSPMIFLWCRQKGLSASQSQDIGQEAWTAVWTSLERFERKPNQHSFRRWLFTIVRNKLIDLGKKKNIQLLPVPDSVAHPEDLAEDSPQVQMLFSQIIRWISGKFSEHNWQAFVLVYAESLERDEVARRLDITRNQVDLACSRIRRSLKEEFGNGLDGE